MVSREGIAFGNNTALMICVKLVKFICMESLFVDCCTIKSAFYNKTAEIVRVKIVKYLCIKSMCGVGTIKR